MQGEAMDRLWIAVVELLEASFCFWPEITTRIFRAFYELMRLSVSKALPIGVRNPY